MIEVRMQVSDKLGQRLRAVLELRLAGFRTPAAETVAEITEFLAQNPSPAKVAEYQVSERAQERLRRLLALNSAGMLSPAEQAELDEIERIEHILVMLKAQAREAVQAGK